MAFGEYYYRFKNLGIDPCVSQIAFGHHRILQDVVQECDSDRLVPMPFHHRSHGEWVGEVWRDAITSILPGMGTLRDFPRQR